MALTKINGIDLNINIKGNGKPLLLIHFLGGNQEQLDIIANPLSKHFKIITFDIRGHGQSEKPKEYTLQDHINDVLSIMDFYNIEKAYLLGVSMGSYIAQGVAIAAPERIEKLILTVPKSNGLTSSVQILFSEHAEEIKGKNFHETILTLLKYFVYNTDIMQYHLDVFETDLTPEQFAAANNALTNFDFRKGLPNITAPTLVISGKYDGLNPPKDGQEITTLIPNATFTELQFSGHAPIYEETERYLKLVEDFLLN
ncbi:alpha/beta hydrolase [Chryseobacterium soli]|uniref:Alpha/beta hydrolase n=1 Tax=Chryseobacterium soli TaxID=445961 RepID=A0A086A3I8_9FLAO|nr:alpha/beta fold hydrolase [Chryseobacterium soli]KFF11252.1 alpha/beta hydrolase [Chryseobacterium soli]